MAKTRGTDFAEILASMDGAVCETSLPEPRTSASRAPADSANLSIRARNVAGRLPNKIAAIPVNDERAPTAGVDAQGNRVLVSGAASDMARANPRAVAWETGIRKKDES
ncbi:MAG: hypothetical protein K2H64_03720 [Desulfovibrio sp.]|nr:hypothetical protein [Desulfovibrio sp.]